jgi:hypothetical protein
MKKITRGVRTLIVLLTVFLFSAGAWAQTNLLSEGFEGGSLPSGWTQNFVFGTTAWTYGAGSNQGYPATAHTGALNARLYYAGYYIKTELITPVIDFTGFTVGRVSFWQAHGNWAGDQDSLTVLYRTSSTSAWRKLNLYQNNLTTWTQTTLTIPNTSATTQICFRGCANFGYGIALDDILVQGLCYGTLTGQVKSNYAPYPAIAGATVVLAGYPNQTTNATGSYTFTNVLAGTYTLNITATGFVATTKPVTVTCNTTTTANIGMDPIPATVTGVVTNAATGAPLEGVIISFGTPPTPPVGINTTRSIAGGLYTLPVYPGGTQYIYASKPGFVNFTSATQVSVTPPGTASLNIALNEAVNPPAIPFTATLNGAQTAIDLSWNTPVGQYMLIYDDGVAENWTVWATTGNKNATKFTPVAYPATVSGGSINIGAQSNYPAGANPMVPFKVGIYDASGPNGTPGVLLGSFQDVTPTAYTYVDFTFASPITIASGSFYIVMQQGGNAPNAAGLAIDTTTQQLRSYSQFGTGPWLPASGNFMIRAVISGTGGPLLANAVQPSPNPITASANPNAFYLNKPGTVTGFEGKGTVIPLGGDPESIIGYEVWRLVQGQETNQTLWTPIGTPTATTMVDNSWPSLACGAYKWAVEAQYTGNRWSTPIFSNIVPKCWTANVTVNLDLSCDSTPYTNTLLELRETTYDSVYTYLITDNSSSHTFTNVWKGTYVLKVKHFAYIDFVSPPTVIMGDYTFNAVLLEIKFPPSGLTVDNRSLLATWYPPVPIIDVFKETFASGSFTTNAWVTAGGSNWAVSSANGNPAPSAEFNWTPEVTGYTQTLTSKTLSGNHAPVMRFKYDIFLNNYGTTALNQMAVEIWDGTVWHTLKNYDNSTGSDIPWTSEDLDITSYSNQDFKIRFRAYGDDTIDIDWWLIDNIEIYGTIPPGPNPCLLGYNFYLNNILDAYTTDTSYVIPPSHVHYGTAYHACVLAIYNAGYSASSCYDFVSKFLYPPTDIAAVAIEDAAYISWKKPVVYADADNFVSVEPRNMPNSPAEYSPVQIVKTVNNSDALWTLLFQYTLNATGEAGIENDATNIYTTMWNTGGSFKKYTKATGAYVGAFTISGLPTGASNGIRDLATDGQYFYGSNSTTSIYKMDFATNTLVSTISTSIAGIRHIAYDQSANGGNGGFWCGAWTTMNLVSMSGASLATNVISGLANCYGCAVDNQSTGGPFLWTFDQNTNGANLVQYKITGTTVAATGVTKDASTLPGYLVGDDIAGGLSVGQVGTKLALIGMIQGNTNPCRAFAYEIGDWSGGGGGGTPPGLIGYKVYRDESFIHYVPSPDTLFYYDMHLDPGHYCYDVTAWYKLDPYGLVGQFDESLAAPNGPACVSISYGIDLPWTEPFTNGFGFYGWTYGTSGQGNWSINNSVGNPAPCADFSWQPIHAGYDYAIVTPMLNAAGWTCADIYLDFDYKLIDRAANSLEKMDIEVYINGNWKSVGQLTNDGSVEWTPEHFELKGAKGHAFKIRFRANGASTDNIIHWYIDNVHVYGICHAPVLNAASQSQFTTNLTWAAPVCGGGGQVMDFIFDDGTAENGWAINPGYLAWLGNEFPISSSMNGVIQQFSVYFMANSSAGADQLTIEVFDGTQTSVGETDPFTPPTDTWLDIPVNDIPFSGMFYAMVKWNNEGGNTNWLGLDEDGPYASQDLEWYYDGATWDKIWIAAGQGNPGVYLLRAKALVSGDLKQVVLNPATPFVPGNTPATPDKFSSAGKHADTHNYSTMMVTSVPDSSSLMGYNVWRTDETGTGPFTMLNTAPVTTTSYTDTYPSTLEAGDFFYYVTAIFQNSQNPGIGTICEPASDTIEVVFPAEGINNLNNSSVAIFPNPANDLVKVTSSSSIKTIEVMNFIGQTVYTNKNVNAKEMEMNVTTFQAGVYIVKITTANGTKTTKITVAH